MERQRKPSAFRTLMIEKSPRPREVFLPFFAPVRTARDG
jgi:hypothetical protein